MQTQETQRCYGEFDQLIRDNQIKGQLDQLIIENQINWEVRMQRAGCEMRRVYCANKRAESEATPPKLHLDTKQM